MSSQNSPLSSDRLNWSLVQQDTFSALIVWGVLAGINWFLRSNFQIFPPDGNGPIGIVISICLGVAGAIMIGMSSGILQQSYSDRSQRGTNKTLVSLAQIMSWLGVICVGNPIIFVVIDLLKLAIQGGRS